MSNIYITEPPTSGKVLLHTSVGDIDIELWSKETPKTCRNFVQLCLEGYYNDTIFHRVVPDFIVQGGDPTGTGTGGESIYGKTFRDEFHSRLRFTRRGLVAMANAGPDDNASQFFFTLAATPELNKKHTIFGKVAGDTLYNMLKLSEVDIGPDERPTHPPKIRKTKILSNPFNDIVPRQVKHEEKQSAGEPKKKSKSKATKNFSLLSFGEEAEEEEFQVTKVNKSMKSTSKSSHDLLHDSKLSAVPAVESEEHEKMIRKQKRKEQNLPELTDSSEDEENIEATKQRIKEKLNKKKEDVKPEPPKRKVPESDSDEDESTKSKTLEELKREAKKLKREILAGRKKDKEETEDPEQNSKISEPQSTDIDGGLAAFKANRQQYKEQQKKKLKKGSDRENQTLAMLAKFQSKLQTAKQFADYGDEEKKEDLEEGEDEEDDPNDVSWMSHQLKFDSKANKVLDANVNDAERYEIFDPRNPMNQRRREASKHALKDKKKSDHL